MYREDVLLVYKRDDGEVGTVGGVFLALLVFDYDGTVVVFPVVICCLEAWRRGVLGDFVGFGVDVEDHASSTGAWDGIDKW